MKVITIQHKSVLDTLIKEGEYRANYKMVSENVVKPYQFMQKHFNRKSCPIFLAPVGHYVEFSGAKFNKDCIAIELNIPDELCKVQLYYDWSDFIYYTEFPREFKATFDVSKYATVEDWAQTILDGVNIKEANKHKEVLQVTVEFLKKEWIVDTLDTLVKLDETHNNSGGEAKLKELKLYR